MQTGAATVESIVELPPKLKIELPYDPVVPLLGIYPKKLKRYKHPYVHWSIIYNHQDLEAAQVSIIRWVDKTLMIHLHNRILLNHEKRKYSILCDSMDGPGEHYAKWNEPLREK